MARSLIKFLLLTLGFLALSWTASRIYDAVVMSDTGNGRVDTAFREQEEPVRLLFLGDSHVMRGIDTRLLDSAYNLCSTGETTLRTWYRLRWVLAESRHADTIDTIVLPVDYTTFATWNLLDFQDYSLWRRYLDFREVGRLTDRRPLTAKMRYLGEFASYWGRRTDLQAWIELDILGTRKPLRMYRGFFPEIGGQRGPPDARARRHFGRQPIVNPILVEYFRRCVILARDLGKRVILLEYPVSRGYDEIAREVFRESDAPVPRASRLARELGVTALSARSLLFEHDDMFWDADHLNEEGARYLTAWLRDRLAELRR